jgi:hypothetical protein
MWALSDPCPQSTADIPHTQSPCIVELPMRTSAGSSAKSKGIRCKSLLSRAGDTGNPVGAAHGDAEARSPSGGPIAAPRRQA